MKQLIDLLLFYSQKEEQLEKLTIQLAELHTKSDEPMHSSMENVSVEKTALEQTLKEVKSRLEQLEVIVYELCRVSCFNTFIRLRNWNGQHRWSQSSVN